MANFSNKFSIGDKVHTTISGQSGALNGEIVAESEVGITIELVERAGGAKSLRFIPWGSVNNIYMKP